MDFSILICTHNRAKALERTLEGLAGLEVPADAEWELILVDNRSTDDTRAVCSRYEERMPLRYLREERQGKSHALNCGLENARAELVILTDDDVDITPGWAANVVAAARENTDADFFGGKVLSRWQGEPPSWFVENVEMIRSNPRVDLGEAPRRFARGDEPRFIGANLAVRKRVFAAGFTFRSDLGPNGDGGKGGRVGPEEMEWQERLLDAGHAGMYVPAAVVYHRDPLWRMTEKYVRHWYTESGRNRVKQGEVPRGREWFGAPRYLWREVLGSGLKYLCTRLPGGSRTWLSAEIRMCTAWGSIKECRAAKKPPGRISTAAILLRASIDWRLQLLARWINGRLERMGPRAFIGARWPWPARKPYMRRELTVQPLGGGLGDDLMCLAVIEEIKRRNPRCHVRFVTHLPDFFRNQPHVDEVLAEGPGRKAPGLIKLDYGFVIPPPRPLISLMGECVGLEGKFTRIPTLTVNASGAVKSLIESLAKPLVVVQPIASGWTSNKNWPLPYWKQCVRGIAARYNVVEVGTEPVLPAKEMGERFATLAGRTSLDDLAYVISQADLFIGPSSSGMHLASAWDVPALIIFGGYESPAGYDYANVHPLYSPVPCAPCWRQSCPYELKCLHAIQPEMVIEQALRLLERSRSPAGQAD